MKRLFSKNLVLPLLILTAVFIVAASVKAHATAQVKESEWQQIVNDKAFGYENEREMRKVKDSGLSANQQNFFSRIVAGLISFFSSPLGKTLVWVFVFLVIAYAIFKIFFTGKTNLFSKSDKEDGNEEGSEKKFVDDIMTSDWETLLKQAINSGNMRMAIRYSYLLLLQLMQRRQMIHYRADKTNYDYYYEIKDNSIKLSFKQLTRQYEFSWYGNYPVPEQAYQAYLNEFNQLKSRLQN